MTMTMTMTMRRINTMDDRGNAVRRSIEELEKFV